MINNRKLAITILICGFIAQVICIFIIGDNEFIPEWSIYLDSLIRTGSYSYNWTEWNTGWLPSAYMPPLYPIFLWIVTSIFQPNANSINDISILTIKIIELLQVGLLIVSSYLIYRITKIITANKTTSIWAATLLIIFPLSIIMSSQISALNLYLLLIITLLYLCIRIGFQKSDNKSNNIKIIFTISIITSLLLLSRIEILLYIPIIFILLLIKTNFKKGILFLIMVLLTLGIIVVRNYHVFDKSYLLSTSGGYNIWRGHNETAGPDGIGYISDDLYKKLDGIPTTNLFEIEQNKVYLNEAITYIKNNPTKLITSSFNKIITLWFYNRNPGDISYNYVLSFWYWFPWLFYLLLSIIGIIIIKGKGIKYLGVLLIGVTITSAIFFVLPRYRLHLLPAIVVYAAIPISNIFNRLFSKFNR